MKLRCSGRSFYASGDILGLGEADPGVLYHGYDGTVDEAEPRTPNDWEGRPPRFTPEERSEIAERMITLWRAWGEASAASAPKAPTK